MSFTKLERERFGPREECNLKAATAINPVAPQETVYEQISRLVAKHHEHTR